MTAGRWTRRTAAELTKAIAEQAAIGIDGGLGASAIAAIMATPPGPARAVEAARWARRAGELVDQVAVVIEPGAGEAFADAHVELMIALAAERRKAGL